MAIGAARDRDADAEVEQYGTKRSSMRCAPPATGCRCPRRQRRAGSARAPRRRTPTTRIAPRSERRRGRAPGASTSIPLRDSPATTAAPRWRVATPRSRGWGAQSEARACACRWCSGPTPRSGSRHVATASRHTASRPAAGGSCGARPARTIQRTRIRSRTRVPTSPSPRGSRSIASAKGAPAERRAHRRVDEASGWSGEIQVRAYVCRRTAPREGRVVQRASSAAERAPRRTRGHQSDSRRAPSGRPDPRAAARRGKAGRPAPSPSVEKSRRSRAKRRFAASQVSTSIAAASSSGTSDGKHVKRRPTSASAAISRRRRRSAVCGSAAWRPGPATMRRRAAT